MTEPLPPIEYSPPFTMAFVAHLQGGCYAEDIASRLLEAVRRDDAGRRMLDAVINTQSELARLGDSAFTDQT